VTERDRVGFAREQPPWARRFLCALRMNSHTAVPNKGGQFCPPTLQIFPCGLSVSFTRDQLGEFCPCSRTLPTYWNSAWRSLVSSHPSCPHVPWLNHGWRQLGDCACAEAPRTPGGSSSRRMRHE